MKIRSVFLFLLLTMAIIIIPNNVFAATEADTDTIIKRVAPDGQNATFYMKKPTTAFEDDFPINGYLGEMLGGDGYMVYGLYHEDDNTCEVHFQSEDYEDGKYLGWDSENNQPIYGEPKGWNKSYTLNMTFVEPTPNSVVNGYINKLKDFDPENPQTYYIIEDLSLINYYLTSDKSELWSPGAPGRALKYSTLSKETNGSNVKYYLDVRAGNQDDSLMFESAFGPMSTFYNGYLYGCKDEGLYLKRVIYIPTSTADTTSAFVDAAQKRINDYLGSTTLAQVSYGGKLSTLGEYSEDDQYPISGNDGNYYNIKIGERTYKFYIVKASDDKLVEPSYIGSDIDSKIEITSKDSTIPLDTSLKVKSVNDASIKDKIGTENYKSYDIELFSDAKGVKIEKIDNGTFLVKIPVPKELEGKELTVYYIPSSGEKEEHQVTIKDGFATFETNHFSVYTLAEKVSSTETTTETKDENINDNEKDETPKTGVADSVYLSLIMVVVSAIGIVELKKK